MNVEKGLSYNDNDWICFFLCSKGGSLGYRIIFCRSVFIVLYSVIEFEEKKEIFIY